MCGYRQLAQSRTLYDNTTICQQIFKFKVISIYVYIFYGMNNIWVSKCPWSSHFKEKHKICMPRKVNDVTWADDSEVLFTSSCTCCRPLPRHELWSMHVTGCIGLVMASNTLLSINLCGLSFFVWALCFDRTCDNITL